MTPEKEQIIQNEAKSWAVAMITGLPVTNEKAWEEIYKAIATKYAEKLEEKDKEVELLTKDIKDQGEYLKEMININVLNDAFNSGEEWRKNHKVKEGEQFTDYFMRVFEVEKEDRDRELAQLKNIGSKLFNSLRDLDFMLSVFDPRVSQNDIRIKVFTLMDMSEKLNGANKT